MNTDKITWVEYYIEFATKLLTYKNERQSLLEKLRYVYQIINVKLPECVCSGMNLDPFTVFSLFNHGITDHNRRLILEGLACEFEITAKVPTDFSGIPALEKEDSGFFHTFEARQADEIDSLWELFECAIQYADDTTSEQAVKFIDAYETVLRQNNLGWNLTVGLYWIRPNMYMSLDARNRAFILSKQLLSAECLWELSGLKMLLNGRQYCTFCQTLSAILNIEEREYSNFPELSYATWSAAKPEQSEEVYFPALSEYNPNLTKEDWKKFILEEMPEHPLPIKMLKAMMELGGEATCRKLAEVYGGKPSTYIGCTMNLARRAKKYFQLPTYRYPGEDKETVFIIPFFGRKVKEKGANLYAYKIRPELEAALKELNLDDIKLEKKLESEEEKTYTDIGKNTILFGPPGTGKTYHAVRYSVAIIENKKIQEIQAENDSEILFRYNKYKAAGLIEFTTFHQSYGYEEFIEGIRPILGGCEGQENEVQYQVVPGLFKKFCDKAAMLEGSKKNYVFVIDEINRGNISKIFGELITLIEPAKRVGRPEGMKVRLPYSKEMFGVTDNVYLIGTMNTADRSIAAIDTALRRRFHFKEMLPDAELLNDILVEGISIKAMFVKMNRRIAALYDREHALGHAYFLPLKEEPTLENLARIFADNIIPLLQEYFYEDYEKIRLVLGDNQKTNREEQFIVPVETDYYDLFGNTAYSFDEITTYEINQKAFENIEAYRLI